MDKYARRKRHFVFNNLIAICQLFSNQKSGHLIKKIYIRSYENTFFPALELRLKHVKTIHLLKGYTDYYSDLNINLQIGLYFY